MLSDHRSPPDTSDLALLIGSRICHDLASPIGAALTGLDFISGTAGAVGAEDMALLRDSLTGARATLEMLRLAFGRSGATEPLDADALHRIVAAHFATRPRLGIDWALAGPLARPTAQTLALALMCAAQALPRGGTLTVAAGADDAITITATGTLAADAALWTGLAGDAPMPAPDPRRIEFHLLAQRIGTGAAHLTSATTPEHLTITLPPPARD